MKRRSLFFALFLILACAAAHAEVVIPRSVQTIGDEAFRNDSAITGAVIPVGCNSIGNYAFSGCTEMESLSAPYLHAIRDHAFEGCVKLRNVEPLDSLAEIGDWAFAGCTSLEEIDISGFCHRIGEYAFAGCGNLTSLKLGIMIESIGDHAFDDCPMLTIHSTNSYIVEYCRRNNVRCMLLSGSCGLDATWEITSDGTLWISGEGTAENDREWLSCGYEIREVRVEEGITALAPDIFSGMHMVSVHLPQTLTEIGSYAFAHNNSLRSVSIPNSVTVLGVRCFFNCPALERIHLPSGLQTLSSGFFESCSSLTEVELPEGLTEISIGCFDLCTALSRINIPESVTEIRSDAFNSCTSLVSLELPRSITAIWTNAFTSSGLEEIYLPKTVSFIADSAFSRCSKDLVARVHEGSYAHTRCVELKINVDIIPIDPDAEREELLTQLDETIQDYLRPDGLISLEDAETAYSLIKDRIIAMYHDKLIAGYSLGSYMVGFRDKYTDENYIYYLPVEDTMGGDLSAPTWAYCFSPQQTENLKFTIAKHFCPSPYEIFSPIRSLPYIDGAYLEDSQVTLSVLENLGPNQIIYFCAHGGWLSSNTGTRSIVIMTHEVAGGDPSMYEGDKPLLFHCSPPNPTGAEKRDHTQYAGFTPRYVKQVCRRLDHSFVFFDSCNSAHDDTLAQAFFDLGADVFIGFSIETFTPWMMDISKTLLTDMCTVNSATGDYYTVGEAYDDAVNKHGRSERVFGSSIVFYGRTDYRFARAEGEVAGTVTGKPLGASQPSPLAGAAAVLLGGGIRMETTTDSQGNFRFSAPAGEYRVSVTANGYGTILTDTIMTEPGKTRSVHVFFDTRTVQGRVCDSLSGAPISGARILARTDRNYDLVTDSEGVFTFTLFQSAVRFELEADGFEPKSVSLSIPSGAASVHTIRMTPLNAHITGYVLDAATGEIIPGAKFTVLRASGEIVPFSPADTPESLPDGSYMITLAPGTYTLLAEKENYASFSEQLVLSAGKTNTLHISLMAAEAANVHGKILSASDRRSPIPNAQIRFMDGERTVRTLFTGDDGSFGGYVAVGRHFVIASANGYADFKGYFEVYKNEENYFETYLMVGAGGGSGTVSGSIVSAYTGLGLSGVELVFYDGWNCVDGAALLTAYTNADGSFSATLSTGNYTVAMHKEGYHDSMMNIAIWSGSNLSVKGSMEPTDIGSASSALITLEWGESPRDLDAYMCGTFRSGVKFTVYFLTRSVSDGGQIVCSLDTDKMDGHGPEHITLEANTDKPYYFYVHRYSTSGRLTDSGAKVSLTLHGSLVRVFTVPTDQPEKEYWNVFAIVNGRIIVRNTITRDPDLSYAGQ